MIMIEDSKFIHFIPFPQSVVYKWWNLVRPLAEVLYNVKNGSPFITSKSSSKNLSRDGRIPLFSDIRILGYLGY